jgi:hypothetical protein
MYLRFKCNRLSEFRRNGKFWGEKVHGKSYILLSVLELKTYDYQTYTIVTREIPKLMTFASYPEFSKSNELIWQS